MIHQKLISGLLNVQLPAAEFDWQPFRPGVDIFPICEQDSGHTTAMLRYEPGATIPKHTHQGVEHLLILAGSQQDENGIYNAGTLITNIKDSSHSVTSKEGCIVLAIWEQPVSFG